MAVRGRGRRRAGVVNTLVIASFRYFLPRMKLLLLLITLGVVAGERSLVWEENFDGDGLDETVWTIKTGNGCDQG